MRPRPPSPAPLVPRSSGARALRPRITVEADAPLVPAAQPKEIRPDASAAPVAPRVVAVEEEP